METQIQMEPPTFQTLTQNGPRLAAKTFLHLLSELCFYLLGTCILFKS